MAPNSPYQLVAVIPFNPATEDGEDAPGPTDGLTNITTLNPAVEEPSVDSHVPLTSPLVDVAVAKEEPKTWLPELTVTNDALLDPPCQIVAYAGCCTNMGKPKTSAVPTIIAEDANVVLALIALIYL